MAESSLAAAANSEEMLAIVAQHLRNNDVLQAIAVAEHEVTDAPSANAVCALSAIAFRQGNIAAAINLLEPLADGLQGSSDIPEALAVLNCLAGRVSEALYYGKLATVQQPDNAVLPLYGPEFPQYADAFLGIEHKPLLGRARNAFDSGDYAAATQWVEQHLQLFRDDVEGLDRYAECLMATGEYRKAVGVLRSVVTLGGPSATLYSRLGQSLVALGEFDQGMACHRQAAARGSKASVLWAAMVRDWAYCPWGGNPAQEQAIAGLAKAIAEAGPKVARRATPVAVKPVLTIGILCNAPHDDDQRALIASVARGFDRGSVAVVGFGPGELGEVVNLAYRGNFVRWRNTNKVDEVTLAAIIRGEGVDVLIDADGLAAREHLSLLTRNVAPLQYSWLNVPLDVRMPGAHGHLGAEAGLASGMLLLPFLEGKPTPLPASSAEGFVTFGADVTLAELNSELVRVWSAILHAVPNSTLVLFDRGFSDPDATGRLIEMFGNFGVAHRIDVLCSTTVAEFFGNVDVALAPFPVVRPTPYGLGLSAGVPVLALAGDSTGFSGALKALGDIGERMLARDVDDYIALAVSLATDLEGVSEFRKTMPLPLRQSVIYSAQALAAEWERFFREKLGALSVAEV